MIHLAWTAMIPDSDPDRPTKMRSIRESCCDCFNLCASVGCKCEVGIGKKLCYEYEAGKSSPLVSSEGPSWTLSLLGLPDRVQIELFYAGPVVGREVYAFDQMLKGFGRAVFQVSAAQV